jgi:branched-chain amino acid transport system permease protein
MLKNLVSVYTHRWLLILGVVYIATIVYAPEGIVGAVRQWRRRVRPVLVRTKLEDQFGG